MAWTHYAVFIVKWFGEDWGAPICQITEQVERPAVHCYMCFMPLGKNARGVVLPFEGPCNDAVPIIEHPHGALEIACHYECFYRALLPEGVSPPSIRSPSTQEAVAPILSADPEK